jgi:hypothetical protein
MRPFRHVPPCLRPGLARIGWWRQPQRVHLGSLDLVPRQIHRVAVDRVGLAEFLLRLGGSNVDFFIVRPRFGLGQRISGDDIVDFDIGGRVTGSRLTLLAPFRQRLGEGVGRVGGEEVFEALPFRVLPR